MDGDEKLPDGWVKVKSKSRPDKQYFYNAALRISLWSLEDLKKHSKGSKKTPSTPAKNPKVASGVAAQSKQIKKNGAQDRMGKLQKVLADEVKRGKKSSADLSKKVEGLKEVISSGTNITVGKNIAAQRMAKLSDELKKEVKDERMEQTIRKPKVSVMKFNAKEIEAKLKNTKVEAQEPITTDVDMMEVSFEHLPEDYEPMEWEDIPEQEIILQVQKIRTTGSQPSSAPPAMFSGGSQRSKIDFHVIVDTNVLLSNIDFVREIKGKVFKGKFRRLRKFHFLSSFPSSRHRQSHDLPSLHRAVRTRPAENAQRERREARPSIDLLHRRLLQPEGSVLSWTKRGGERAAENNPDRHRRRRDPKLLPADPSEDQEVDSPDERQEFAQQSLRQQDRILLSGHAEPHRLQHEE